MKFRMVSKTPGLLQIRICLDSNFVIAVFDFQIKTVCRCFSDLRKSASSTAWHRPKSIRRIRFRRRIWTSCKCRDCRAQDGFRSDSHLTLTANAVVYTLRIYDEESDRHVHISFLQALAATCYGQREGPRGDLFDLANLKSKKVEEKLEKNESENANEPTTYSQDYWVDLGTKAVKSDKAGEANAEKAIVDALEAAIKANMWVPVEIVIARPFIEHLMLSAIVTVGGRDTGATLFGPADMYECLRFEPKCCRRLHCCGAQHIFVFALAGKSRPTRRSRRSRVQRHHLK